MQKPTSVKITVKFAFKKKRSKLHKPDPEKIKSYFIDNLGVCKFKTFICVPAQTSEVNEHSNFKLFGL